MNQNKKFRVGLTRDFLTPDGQLTYNDIGLGILDAEPHIEYFFFDEHHSPVLASQLAECDAVISLSPKYTTESFVGLDHLLAVARMGVGYDMVDVNACTHNGILLSITAGAVNHSVAEATIGWMLALSHRMVEKDRLVREGGWAERSHYMGTELREKSLGIIGLGGIGGKLIEMLRCFRMKEVLVYDPFLSEARAKELGARIVSLNELMQASDFISVNCPLNESTRGLIGREQLELMKPSAYLVNTARGGIVDEDVLSELLLDRRIAGAATDVFAEEPVTADNPLLIHDDVLLAPHCIAWTHELFRDMGRMACEQIVLLSRGEIPHGVINREVLERSDFQAKLARFEQSAKRSPADAGSPDKKADVKAAAPLAGRPAGFEPDRPEAITTVAEAAHIEIAPGVILQPLVGEHNQARNLTTGIVTIAAGVTLPYHTHTFSESITLLSGGVRFDAEGRQYTLQQLDNAVIPAGVAHSVANLSPDQPARLHVALASGAPDRELVADVFPTREMAPDDAGHEGRERVNRQQCTPFYEPNPGAHFQDWFNRDMGCPEMSGGYGIFSPGSQLPCHIHDFDESITIVEGNATCMVEGKKYSLSDCTTALVPRGRAHYFINDTDQPMTMIWVYAGPTPERIVLDSCLCDLPPA